MQHDNNKYCITHKYLVIYLESCLSPKKFISQAFDAIRSLRFFQVNPVLKGKADRKWVQQVQRLREEDSVNLKLSYHRHPLKCPFDLNETCFYAKTPLNCHLLAQYSIHHMHLSAHSIRNNKTHSSQLNLQLILLTISDVPQYST